MQIAAKSTLTWCIYETGYFLGSIRSTKRGSQHKTKLGVSIIAIMGNTFLEFEIYPEKYQWGKLNGADCK